VVIDLAFEISGLCEKYRGEWANQFVLWLKNIVSQRPLYGCLSILPERADFPV
jgi:hypothetical protein